MTNAAETVSVIVPTRDSIATLARCLTSIRGQGHERVELVVVDNFSQDGTLELARRHADLVIQTGPERSAQRNRGVAESSGEYVLLIDSDMELSPAVVAECVACARDSGAVAVTIPERSAGDGLWAAARALERSCYVGDDTIEAPRFFTRAVFLAYGGYDETIWAGEDWDLPARMRGREQFGRVDAEIIHLEGRIRLAEHLRKKYYYGRSFAGYMRRHPGLARRQLMPLRPAFVRHRHRLAKTPALTAAMLLLKATEFAAGGAGFLSSAILKQRRVR